MRTFRVIVAAGCAAASLGVSACTPPVEAPPASGPTPAAPTPATTAPGSPTPTPAPDLTRPGAALAAVERLLDAAGTGRALMVTVNRTEALVSVLRDGAPETWALRDGAPQQVQTDLWYVDQAVFDVGDFALGDVGALFRAAAAVSGSTDSQELQIVDYSGGQVMMTVSTNPESRTVFFTPAGVLLTTLDLTSGWGLARAYDDVVGVRRTATALGFGSPSGVYLEHAGPEPDTTVRLLRTARFPVTVGTRSGRPAFESFSVDVVRPERVWAVLERERAAGRFTLDQPWSCVVEDREGTGIPQFHFTVGLRTFRTSPAGTLLG